MSGMAMAIPWLVNGLTNMARKGSRNRKANAGYEEMMQNLSGKAGPKPNAAQQSNIDQQSDPTWQLLNGGAPQQSNIPTGKLDSQTQDLMTRSRAVHTAKGPQSAFDYLQQATDPATYDARMAEKAKSGKSQLEVQRMQDQDAAFKKAIANLDARAQPTGTPSAPPRPTGAAGNRLLANLTTELGRNVLTAQGSEDGAETIMQAMGIRSANSPNVPARIQVYEHWKNLGSKEEQRDMLATMRDGKVIRNDDGSVDVYNPATGELDNLMSKEAALVGITERKRQERISSVMGDAEGAARVGLQGVYNTTQQGFDTVAAIRDHPGLGQSVGAWSLNPLKLVPGTDAHNFSILVDQQLGQMFKQAYESLKGGGQITEFETKSVVQGIARIKASQSKDEFLRAVNDLESTLLFNYEYQKSKAAGDFSAPSQLSTQSPLISAGGRAGANVSREEKDAAMRKYNTGRY